MLKAYENNKSSISPFKRDIPAHWDEHKVSWIFSFKSIQNNIGEELLSVFLNKGVVSYSSTSQKQVHKPSDDLSKYQLVENGDFVLNNQQAWRGSVGVSKYRGIISPAYYVLEPRINIHSDFLNYLVRDRDVVDQFVLASKGVGSIQRQIYVPYLKSVILALPPREEQDQIVRFLNWKTSEMAHFIHEKKKEIKRLEELKKSIVNQAVTKGLNPTVAMQETGIDWAPYIPSHWQIKKLKEITTFINRGSTPSYINTSGVMVVNQATFSKGIWDISDVRFTSAVPNKSRGHLQKYDVLLASTGGGILGKTYYFEEEGRYIADSHVTIIRSGSLSVAKFIFYHFSVKYELMNAILAKGSTNQTELQRTWLRDFLLPVPPIEEQETIANYLDEKTNEIFNLIQNLKKEIALVQELRTKTISDVVTGKVDVRSVVVPDYVPEEDEVDLDEEIDESEEVIEEEADD